MNCNDFFFFWVFAYLSGSTLPNVFVGKAFLEGKGMFTRRSGEAGETAAQNREQKSFVVSPRPPRLRVSPQFRWIRPGSRGAAESRRTRGRKSAVASRQPASGKRQRLVIRRRCVGLRDEPYLHLKVLACMLPRHLKPRKITHSNTRRPFFFVTTARDVPDGVPSVCLKEKEFVPARCDCVPRRTRSDSSNSYNSPDSRSKWLELSPMTAARKSRSSARSARIRMTTDRRTPVTPRTER